MFFKNCLPFLTLLAGVVPDTTAEVCVFLLLHQPGACCQQGGTRVRGGHQEGLGRVQGSLQELFVHQWPPWICHQEPGAMRAGAEQGGHVPLE
jgi:hypothetical protein